MFYPGIFLFVLGVLSWDFPVVLGALSWDFPVVLGDLSWDFPVVLVALSWDFPVVLGVLSWVSDGNSAGKLEGVEESSTPAPACLSLVNNKWSAILHLLSK